ncbi:putative ATP:guanido phosphotransferase domain protein [Peptoniphilus sp. ING2-D1G]|nr:putative ATP:guanido phosphotransferase domain protein [Peptoniphilus sp. ING2-D1G]
MSVILYNELKLSRNVSGLNFPSKIDNESAERILTKLDYILSKKEFKLKRTRDLSSLEKLQLYEDCVLNASILKHEHFSAVFIDENDLVVRVNGDNHIEIYKSTKEKNLPDIFEQINEVDDYIDDNIKYAFREDFGYLNSNPNYCGNGLVAEVYLHLPAINYFGRNSLMNTLNRLGYNISSLNMGDKAVGSIYKLSLDRTIGIDEKEYLSKLINISNEIEDMEEQNRKKLYLDEIIDLEDLVNRAFGILRNSRVIDELEMIDKMSDLFLGIELSILKPKEKLDLIDSIKQFKNGHLQVERGALLDEKSRNILRANNIRKMMKEVF